jgi:glutamate N-acetyltransferase/amino-acid N-acetyltransferase
VDIVLGQGKGTYTLLASDLSHEYVSINADYRS